MQYRRLGRTNLRVSVLGLGGGGRSRLGVRGDASADDVLRLVHRALDLGINLFDTAADYGTEELLGAALAGTPRDSIVVSTKFGATTRDGQLKSPSALRSSLDQSLTRLRMDYVDVLYLHGVRADHYTTIRDAFREPLREAEHAGLTHFIGVTESWGLDHAHAMLRSAIPSGVWDVVMPGYNLLSPLTGEHVLPLAAEYDVGTMVMCAVRSVISQPPWWRSNFRTGSARACWRLTAPMIWTGSPGTVPKASPPRPTSLPPITVGSARFCPARATSSTSNRTSQPSSAHHCQRPSASGS